jgi:predicted RNA-binding protein (virulence factor B family)
MMKLGEKQTLQMVKKVDFGVYLAEIDGDQQEKILLPGRQVPEDLELGGVIEVFVYRDSKDRMIATTNEPKLQVGQVGVLQVAQTGKFGAFLDWGLEKDVMLPFRQQTKAVQAGDEVLVAIYIDKSNRLCATMNVYPYLRTDSPYHKDDWVVGCVYEISKEFGAFVAVDNQFSALIPQKEMYGQIGIGDNLSARVTEVKGDGKLNLSVREKSYIQIVKDAKVIIEMLEESQGQLPFTDKASPELILRETGMSKNEFKRAVGNLIKNGKIEISGTTILLKEQQVALN